MKLAHSKGQCLKLLVLNEMASKMFKSLILGAPASGKGTISSRIVKNFNLEHISSGDLLRLNIKNKTSK